MAKDGTAYRTIGEVAADLDVPQHVLRFWEARFPQIAPRKSGGGRRYYRPEDVALLAAIRRLLHVDGYTIKGVQRLIRTEGVHALRSGSQARAGEPNAEVLAGPPPEVAAPSHLPTGPTGGEALDRQLQALADVLDTCVRRLATARRDAERTS